MPRSPSKNPTELELEILKALWQLGPSPARAVVDALHSSRGSAYTSIVTVMNIMTRKGYLKRVKTKSGFIYKAVASERKTVGKMLRDLVDRAFAGSSAAAVLNLLQISDLNDAELASLRELVERKTKGK